MKKILMITTGGTVCSTDEGGLTPTMGPDAALKYIPSVYKLCNVDFLPLYSIDSTNMEPRHWLGMAKAIKDNYESYDGFVILHGTDTMSYTGAALSYLIQNSSKARSYNGISEACQHGDNRRQAQYIRQLSLCM